MPVRKHRTVFIVLITAIAGTVSILAIMTYCGIATSLEAECSLHANRLVVDLVRQYVVEHQGQWPRSWQDLETLPAREWGMYRWPEDREKIKRYVSVDFAADPDRLATQSPEQFNAIEPTGPCYPYEEDVTRLLDAIRQSRQTDQ